MKQKLCDITRPLWLQQSASVMWVVLGRAIIISIHLQVTVIALTTIEVPNTRPNMSFGEIVLHVGLPTATADKKAVMYQQ